MIKARALIGIGAAVCLSYSSGVPQASAAKKEAIVVAVFDIVDRSNRFSAAEVEQLTAYLSVQLASDRMFKVIPRAQVREALVQAQQDSYKSCYDEQCQIEIGRALAAEKSVVSRIISIGTRCAVTVALFDLRSSTTEQAGSRKTTCDQDALVTALEQVASTLKRRLRGPVKRQAKRAVPPPPSPRRTRPASPSRSPALVAQADTDDGGNGMAIAAWTAAGVAAVGLGIGVGFTIKALGHESNANDADFVGGQREISDAETAELISFIGYGVAAAGVVTAVTLWLLDDDSDATATLVPAGPNGSVGIAAVGRF